MRQQAEWHLHIIGRTTGSQVVKQKAKDMPVTMCVLHIETDTGKSEGFWEGEREGVGNSPSERARVQSPVSCKVSCDHISTCLES